MKKHNKEWLGSVLVAVALGLPATVLAEDTRDATAPADGHQASEHDHAAGAESDAGTADEGSEEEGSLEALLERPDPGNDDFDPILPLWGQYTIERLTPSHDRVSRWVDNTARNIDNFFGTDESYRVNNDSFLRVSQDFIWEESDGFDYDIGLRFRLDLPTARENLRLIIESDPEETEGTLSEQGSRNVRSSRPESSRTVVGLGRFLGRDRTERWDANINAGVRVRWPLDPYIRLTGERLWDLGDNPWMLESNNRLAYFYHDGLFARTRWDLGRPYGQRDHLRFITNIQWREDEPDLEYYQATEWNRILGPRSVIRYAGVAVGKGASSPRAEDFYVLVDYRRNIHREILFLDLVPELHFPREANFDPRWMMTVRLEIFFRAAVSQRDWRTASVHRDLAESPWVASRPRPDRAPRGPLAD